MWEYGFYTRWFLCLDPLILLFGIACSRRSKSPLLVFPAYVLPGSPPSELRALLFKCLEQATFGSNFSAKSIFQRVIGQLMELFIVLLGRSCPSFGQMGHLMTLWQSREPPAVNVWSQKYDSGRAFPTQPSLVCYTAVFSSSPQTVCVEERCVTTLKTAV